MTDYSSTHKILQEAQDVLNSFDDEVKLVNIMPFPIEVYVLVANMRAIITEKLELDKEQKSHAQANRFAVEELADRLSDALSENITLTVRLRIAEENNEAEVAAENQAAADKFMAEFLADLFTTSVSTTDKETKQ